MSWIKAVLGLALAVPRRIVDVLFGYDFFLSYSHGDGEEYARALDKALSERYTVHLDTRDYHVGQDLRVLTRLRVRNSRLLVVIGRPLALTRSYWVRREVEMFHDAGRHPVVIDVDQAVEQALAAPPQGSLAAWLAAHREVQNDGSFIYPMLLEIDAVHPPVAGARVPQPQVIERLQQRFNGDRVETRRLRIVTAALFILVLALAATVWQAYVAEGRRQDALRSLAQANANELAARARVTSGERPDLALVLAMHSVEVARVNGVSTIEGASALRDVMSQTRGTRQYCLQQGEGRSLEFSRTLGLLAVATDAGAVCLFRQEEDGALRLLDMLQSFSGGTIEAVRFSADGEWLVTHMRGGSLRTLPVGAIYRNKRDVQQGAANYRFDTFGNTDSAEALSIDEQASRVAFVSQQSGQIEIWPLLGSGPTSASLVTLEPGADVLATAFDPAGSHIAALLSDETRHESRRPQSFRVKIWSLSPVALIREFRVLDLPEGIYLGDGIAMGTLRGTLRVGPGTRWITVAMALADSHSLEARMVAQVIHVPDQRVIANFTDGSGDRSFDGWGQVSEIGFTKDGKAFFALNDSVVRFWALELSRRGAGKARRLRELTTPSGRAGARKARGVVSAIAFSADDTLLATLDSADALTVWNVAAKEDGTATAPLMFVEGVGEASLGTPTALAFSQDGETVFFAAGNGEVRACYVRNRCGSIAPQQASAPRSGGQWKQISVPAHGKWIAAVSEQQVVSFFRPNDLRTPFLDVLVSDQPAPVISRGYAILSGTPGRSVGITSSADATWAAVFEQQQYGYHGKLRLVRLTEPTSVIDVNLKAGDCDGRFATVEFDPFAPYIVVLSKLGCIAFAKLPNTGAEPIFATHPLPKHKSGTGLPALTFTRDHILVVEDEGGQLWHRDEKTGLPSNLLLNASDGRLLLSDNRKHVIVASTGADRSTNSLAIHPLTSARLLGPPIAVGEYRSVRHIATRGDVAVVIGTRREAAYETVAIWLLAAPRAPLIEQPSNVTGSETAIVFDETAKRFIVGPTDYSLKKKRPDPRAKTAILFDLSNDRPSSRRLAIDLGEEKEDCSTSGPKGNDGSCYELRYSFSPDGAWLAVSRDQSFGSSGPATIWSLGATIAPHLSFPAGSDVDFDATSRWLIASSEGEQRMWRLADDSATWIDQGRVASSGVARFLQNGRMLTFTSGELTVQPLDIHDLMTRVPDFIGRNLSPSEWTALFPRDQYKELFPKLPPHVARVSDLVNRAEVLASSNRRDEAADLLELAAQLATRVGDVATNTAVVEAALGVGLAPSANASLDYVGRILPKDGQVQKLRERVAESQAAIAGSADASSTVKRIPAAR